MKRIFLILLSVLCFVSYAEELRYSVGINFRQGRSELELEQFGNNKSLEEILRSMKKNEQDTSVTLTRVLVVGGASPEGSIMLNRRLSERRADVLFNYLASRCDLPDSLKATMFLGRDWNGLIRNIEGDSLLPFYEETMQLLKDIRISCYNEDANEDALLRKLRVFKGGEPYRYMYKKYFPALRASRIQLWYNKRHPVPVVPEAEYIPITVSLENNPAIAVPISPFTRKPEVKKPFYMAVKTNMLYDAGILPNVGVEFYLGKEFSIGANWLYGWWKTDKRKWYWRAYGGEVEARYWLGKKAKEKPLTGHHLGIYGQVLTYDFLVGHKGVIGGQPGGSLWDQVNYGIGISYGYSLPIRKRLNIDFSIGLGYFGGQYWEYEVQDNCYVWQATKKRNYFGPTKFEVSLVWLIGRGNVNPGKKGGRR